MEHTFLLLTVGFVVGYLIGRAHSTDKDIFHGAKSQVPTLSLTESMDEIRRLAKSGKTIDAIKLYRQASGIGLKEAKDEVEKIVRE